MRALGSFLGWRAIFLHGVYAAQRKCWRNGSKQEVNRSSDQAKSELCLNRISSTLSRRLNGGIATILRLSDDFRQVH